MKWKQVTNPQSISNFLSSIYVDACRRASCQDYSSTDHQKQILQKLSNSKITYKSLSNFITYTKSDFVADVLEVTQDFKKVLQTRKSSSSKFAKRSNSHFGGGIYQKLQKNAKEKHTSKVLKMYEGSKHFWSQNNSQYFKQNVYPNCVYLMGISKGNGVIIDGNCIVSCAHVFTDQTNNKLMKLRCFSTALGGFGIVKLSNSGVFSETDLCFCQITYYEGPQISKITMYHAQIIKFKQQFLKTACLQVGLLYIPDEQFLCTFETAEGFIERNDYDGQEDKNLAVGQMGKLVHNCFGMWGTSGSPLWNAEGHLLGLHNSWNQEGYNVSMIVHNNQVNFIEQEDTWVVKQYERRAISIHAINYSYNIWINASSQQNELIQKIEQVPSRISKKKHIKKQEKL